MPFSTMISTPWQHWQYNFYIITEALPALRRSHVPTAMKCFQILGISRATLIESIHRKCLSPEVPQLLPSRLRHVRGKQISVCLSQRRQSGCTSFEMAVEQICQLKPPHPPHLRLVSTFLNQIEIIALADL